MTSRFAISAAVILLVLPACNRDAGRPSRQPVREPIPERTAAVFSESARQRCPRLYQQISNRPEQDARERVRQGDRRVIATLEPGFEAPGLSDEQAIATLTRGPSAYRTLEGTGDLVDQNSCFDFHNDTPHYMERYNREVLKLQEQ